MEVTVDVEEFDGYINEAELAFAGARRLLLKAMKAIALYNGDFLPHRTDTHWFMTLNAFYHSRYVNTVKALAKLYIDTGRYEKLEQLCTRAIVYERSDEQIYSYLIVARMRTKRYRWLLILMRLPRPLWTMSLVLERLSCSTRCMRSFYLSLRVFQATI